MIKIKELKDVLEYNEHTGIFSWKISPCKNVKIGSVAGTLHKKTGYIKITYKNNKISAHRLSWAFMLEEWPAFDVDHINGNRQDNRWVNLRQATRQQNSLNRLKSSRNTSGVKGVHFDRKRNKWGSTITFDKTRYWLGFHSSLKQAEDAVVTKRKELHGTFSNDG